MKKIIILKKSLKKSKIDKKKLSKIVQVKIIKRLNSIHL